MATKYEELEKYLQGLRLKTQKVSLSFKDIESIIRQPLPRSAFVYRELWSNQKDTSNRPQAKAWLAAGYKVDSVLQQPATGSVVFVRTPLSGKWPTVISTQEVGSADLKSLADPVIRNLNKVLK